MKCFSAELLRFTKTERLQEFVRSDTSCFNCQKMVLAYLGHVVRVRSWRDDSKQVYALLAAKWTFEIPSVNSDPMSWYWRSPPKGKRELGRKYLSTNQAWNAMRKASATP